MSTDRGAGKTGEDSIDRQAAGELAESNSCVREDDGSKGSCWTVTVEGAIDFKAEQEPPTR